MNAVDILTKDHREVDAMIAELEKAGTEGTSDASLQATFQQMVNALGLHMQAEENIFYPAMQKFDEEKDQVVEAYDEHNEVKGLLLQMQNLEPSSAEFQSNLKMVKTGIEHHVAEEEGEMFPDAKNLLGEARLQEIGQQIMTLKTQGDPMKAFSA
jgi:hemerythrin superfamily protein